MYAWLPVPFATTRILSVMFIRMNVLRGLAAKGQPQEKTHGIGGGFSFSSGGCATLTHPTQNANRV
ncbi:hypothetical protein AGJ25_17570, partial [Cronobacter sakazakii]|nr:hypothetical protein [Cronobacter sakazakii]EGT5652973.1 hypothetical protein [Cronobacter sakazakii]EGT5750547.1 hypothetical protein [Cronobacter sakazakii]EGT5754998.1 hypothetical protein [Cronobacter sakazakii]